MNREEELAREGWERKTTCDEPRLSEIVEMYKELGFEVLVEPFNPEGQECAECMKRDPGRFKTVYTRRPASPD